MKNHKSGQVVLIVLLVMVVVLTIGLSLISRSVTDISISKDEEEAIRAFSAAEAGIEAALQNIGAAPSTIVVDGITANVNVSGEDQNLEFNLAEGEYLDLDLTGASVGTRITLEWDAGAAVETSFYKSDNTVQRYIYQSDTASCLSGIISTEPDEEFQLRGTTANDQMLRIRALCSPTNLDITVSNHSLADQAHEIDSRASEDGKTSAIQVTRRDELPSIFDYVVFSKGTITHSEYP
jgi:hypothetical protein